eukprot:2044633-Ditylum_brightwellii.AAC.1
MGPSTFSCSKDEFRWLKKRPDDTEVANMTVINLCLQILGPMSERTLCIVLLTLQFNFIFWNMLDMAHMLVVVDAKIIQR